MWDCFLTNNYTNIHSRIYFKLIRSIWSTLSLFIVTLLLCTQLDRWTDIEFVSCFFFSEIKMSATRKLFSQVTEIYLQNFIATKSCWRTNVQEESDRKCHIYIYIYCLELLFRFSVCIFLLFCFVVSFAEDLQGIFVLFYAFKIF